MRSEKYYYTAVSLFGGVLIFIIVGELLSIYSRGRKRLSTLLIYGGLRVYFFGVSLSWRLLTVTAFIFDLKIYFYFI